MQNQYYLRDARELTQIIKTPVDIVITSPPYFDMKNYEADGQIGFGQDYKSFLTDIKKVFSQCLEVTRKTGSMWIIVDTLKKNGRFILLPFDIIEAAKATGWRLQEIIIWKKDRTLPYSHKGEMRNSFEYVLFFVQGGSFKYYPERIASFDVKRWWVKYPERYSIAGKAPTDVWEFPIPVQGSWGNQYIRHFCPLPQPMVKQIIELCTDTGDTVLDPFAGSGAVLASAYLLNRKFIGCDINPQFKTMSDDYLQALQKEKDGGLNNGQQKKALFAGSIKKLRFLKLPSALLKVLRRESPETFEGIFGVRVTPTNKTTNKKHKHWCVEYTFFVKADMTEKRISEIKLRLTKPPLSKYGIEVELRFERHELPLDKCLNLYDWDATYRTAKPFNKVTGFPYIVSALTFTRKERKLINRYL